MFDSRIMHHGIERRNAMLVNRFNATIKFDNTVFSNHWKSPQISSWSDSIFEEKFNQVIEISTASDGVPTRPDE